MFSFDARPTYYFVFGYGLLWMVGVLAVTAPARGLRRSWWQRRSVFLLMALVALIFMRLPVLVYNQELNPDESQMITQGMTLAIDPVFWRSVDGTTGGPLDSYLLLVPSWLGAPFDYIRARMMGIVCVILSLWLLFRTAEVWFGEDIARLALVPALVLLAVTQHYDLVHYSSEHLPMALLGGIYFLVAYLQRSARPTYRWVYLAGFLAGMVPFGKLQGVPMAFVAGSCIALDLLTRNSLPLSQRLGRIGLLVAGGLSFPLLVVLLTRWNGVYDDFVTFYIVGNFQYGSGGSFSWVKNLTSLPDQIGQVPGFYWLLALPALLAGLAVLVWLRNRPAVRVDWRAGIFLVLLLGATCLAITRTGSGYTHYLLFAVAPCALMAGWLLDTCLKFAQIPAYAYAIRGGIMVLLLLGFTVPFVNKLSTGKRLNVFVQNNRAVPVSAESRLILQYARPGEPLVVWGWMCRYHVETQMPQGVNENHSIRSAFEHPLKHIYLARYLVDLSRSYPPVFVDAVGHSFWLNDRTHYAHEKFPALRSFIESHYRFAGEVNKTRIYVRADRFKPNGQLADMH